MADNQEPTQPNNLSGLLTKFGDDKFKTLSKGRYAEELQWYQASLFDQLKQWLTLDGSSGTRRWKQIPQNNQKPMPMPVSNYFSKTINSNANSLGADIPEMVANPADTSNPNRRAAESAERAMECIDDESGMEHLNPILAKHTVLWGLGVIKDVVDTSAESGMDQIPQLGDAPEGELNQTGVASFPKGKIKSELPSIFEIYVERDCHNANLSRVKFQRFRKPLAEIKGRYGDVAKDLRADDNNDTAQLYAEAIRSEVNFGSVGQANSDEMITLKEYWAKWDRLPEDVQAAIEQRWGNQPSAAYPQMSKWEAAQQYGIYCVYAQKTALDYAENPWEDYDAFTFFPWQMDSANPYPKGLSPELIPLQKQLNRLDSLMEKSLMSNGVGKWILPLTQINITKPSGDPSDAVWYDSQGDGKNIPQFVPGQPHSPALVERREAILNDFRELGYTNGVEDGSDPEGGVKSFRGIAFLGAKAEEGRKTQRFLWEQAHKLRKKKLLIMAQKVWDEPRQVKTAGFNGKFGMTDLMGADLQGDYVIDVIPDSSKPKTQQEKLSAVEMLITGGVIDPTAQTTKEYILDSTGMNGLNITNHYQLEKAERDLEMLKQGKQPLENPAQKWDVWVRTLGDYMQTEEYEQLEQPYQMGIAFYFQYVSDKLTAIKQTMSGAPPLASAAAPQPETGKQGGANPLGAVPGQSANVKEVEGAAAKEAAGVAHQASQ